MAQQTENAAIDRLAVFVGEWSVAAEFKGLPPAGIGARVVFEWMPGRRFLIQRWEVPAPHAPDGIAIIGADPESDGNFLQHYFDSRGVARVYKMSVSDRSWKLWRDTPDFSPLEFAQRYTGAFGDDGKIITGSWEICPDGATWEHDFATVVPAVNQIECHPYFQQRDVQDFNAAHGILTQAWSPIGGITFYRDGTHGSTLDDPVIGDIARAHAKTPAQVMLRWGLQHARSVIPKSTKPSRIAENINVFDFELSAEEVAAIDGLDTGRRGGPEPDAIALDAFGREIPEA